MKYSKLLKDIETHKTIEHLEKQRLIQQKIEYLNRLMLDEEYWVNVEQDDYDRFFPDYDEHGISVSLSILAVGILTVPFVKYISVKYIGIVIAFAIIISIVIYIKYREQTKVIFHKDKHHRFVSKHAIQKEIDKTNKRYQKFIKNAKI